MQGHMKEQVEGQSFVRGEFHEWCCSGDCFSFSGVQLATATETSATHVTIFGWGRNKWHRVNVIGKKAN